MPHRLALILCTVLFAAISGAAHGQRPESQVHAALTLMSDYKHFGLSQSDSGPAAKLAFDYAHHSGFFAGGFLANVEYAAEYGSTTPRNLQVNAYAGYQWRSSQWSANAIVSRYIYPDIEVRYDYTQTAINFGLRDRYFVGASYSKNFFSIDRSAYQYYAGITIPLRSKLEVGINIGRFRSRELSNTSYTFWDIGLSRAFRQFAVDLRYHENTYGRTTRLGDGNGDRWVLSVSYVIVPRGPN
ncbi:MAG: TorF family putative porin [Gammaproteobacteria bacterium]